MSLLCSARGKLLLREFFAITDIGCWLATALLAIPALAQQKPPDLTEQSLEELMDIQVTSISKTEQKLSRTASTVFVITQEDMRRSGALNVPDILRMVPGLDVAQNDANTWAIGARGFNGRYANEVLVMVDGRSMYTPTSGGVYWDLLDLPLGDIERIEVIRGLGGSLVLFAILGNPHYEDETVTAYEMGYRTTVHNRVSLDVAAYYNVYGNQGTTEPSTPFFEATPAPAHLVVPLTCRNLMRGETHGLEMAVNWRVTDRWTVSPGYAFEGIHMHFLPDHLECEDTTGSARSTLAKRGAYAKRDWHLR